jgi:hypothetical protein
MLPLWALIRRHKSSMNGTRLVLMSHTLEINIRGQVYTQSRIFIKISGYGFFQSFVLLYVLGAAMDFN